MQTLRIFHAIHLRRFLWCFSLPPCLVFGHQMHRMPCLLKANSPPILCKRCKTEGINNQTLHAVAENEPVAMLRKGNQWIHSSVHTCTRIVLLLGFRGWCVWATRKGWKIGVLRSITPQSSYAFAGPGFGSATRQVTHWGSSYCFGFELVVLVYLPSGQWRL